MFALLLLIPGIWQLMGKRGAWHAGMTVLGILLAYIAYKTAVLPFTAGRVILLSVSLLGIWNYWNDRQRVEKVTERESTDTGPKRSLVLWLSGSRFIDAGILRQSAARAFDLLFDDEGSKDAGFVAGKGNNFIVGLRGMWFLIHSWDTNYFDEPEAVAAEIKELRRAHVVRGHQAWLSVDFMRSAGGESEEEIMATIGRLLSALSADDVVAVFHPETGRIAPWSAAFNKLLLEGLPLKIFESTGQAPVIPIAGDSDEMLEAVVRARGRWPEFVAAFQSMENRDKCLIKAPVTEAGQTEFIWIIVKAIEGDKIHGLLANDPVALGALKINDLVSVDVNEISDWLCPSSADQGQPMGLFTAKVLAGTQRRQGRPVPDQRGSP